MLNARAARHARDFAPSRITIGNRSIFMIDIAASMRAAAIYGEHCRGLSTRAARSYRCRMRRRLIQLILR